MLRCEADNTGFFRSDIGLHQIMLIIREAIIRLCIGVDLLQGFFVQLIAGVLGNVLVQGIDDLLFQGGSSDGTIKRIVVQTVDRCIAAHDHKPALDN